MTKEDILKEPLKKHSLTPEELCSNYRSLGDMIQGTRFKDKFVIIKKIGEGGFSKIFEAINIEQGNSVAIKFLDPNLTLRANEIIRVKREISISNSIDDPKILKIYSLDFWEGGYYMVMELVKGRTLEHIFSKYAPLEWEDFKPYFLIICEAVNCLHKNNIIHRDLKPSNIMVTEDNEIKILDFGMAKNLDDAEKTSSDGELVGSPNFVSPDQLIFDSSELDSRSDLYQLGLILYYSLSGTYPFKKTSTVQLLADKVHKDFEISVLDLFVSDHMKFCLHKCLATERDQRFTSISEFIDALYLA